MDSLLFVAGARPNFMKLAPILRELEGRKQRPLVRLVHTGQHYDRLMSAVFFEELGIPAPDVHLQIGGGTHGNQTGRIMIELDAYLETVVPRPTTVVVVGDVNSTLAAALVATKRGMRVVHVEAGLRSFDRSMPEEVNRIVTDAISDRLLVSEPSGLVNLANEGVPSDKVRYCGNVMIDTLVHELDAAKASDAALPLASHFAVATLHRPANVDVPVRLAELVGFLNGVADRVPLVFPVHPRTARALENAGLRLTERVTMVEPLGYRAFINLVARAQLVVTDSGGIQEETTYLRVPCITLRRTTERPVTITHGTNVLAGDDLATALVLVERALRGEWKTSRSIDGWDGRAASRVVDALLES